MAANAKRITINLYFHIKLRMLSKYTTKVQSLTPFATRAFAGASAGSEPPKRVLVSGAAGQIAYSIVFRIAS